MEGRDDEEEEDEDVRCCEDCDAACSDDDLYTTHDGDGPSVCSDCLNRNYTEVASRYGTMYVDNDSAVFCESDRRWYGAATASEYDVYMSLDGNYYKSDDLVTTMEGDAPADSCIELDVDDVDGNSWAEVDNTVKTHDKRIVRHDESWEDYFTHMVYHQDDELDNGVILSLPMPGALDADFTTVSMFENLHRFYVVDSTLILSDGCKSERGAIPLSEYLMTFGWGVYGLNNGRLSTNLCDAIREIHDDLLARRPLTNIL